MPNALRAVTARRTFVTNLHSPCFAQTARTSSSVANSPRAASASEASRIGGFLNRELIGWLFDACELQQNSREIVLRLIQQGDTTATACSSKRVML
jgi:hypothetical protein